MIVATRPRSAELRRQDIASGLTTGTGLWQAIAARAADHPDCSLTFLSEQWPACATVGGLLAQAEAVAASLLAMGLQPGDVIAVQLPHGKANALVTLAAIRLGLIITPLASILGQAEIGFILRQTRAKAMVLPSHFRGIDYIARFRSAGPLPDCEHLLVLGDDRSGALSLDDLLAQPGRPLPACATTGDDIFALIYTSGTTAAPKGVIHSHNSFAAEMLFLGRLIRPPWSGGFLNAMPAGHIAGLIATLRPFFHGNPCVYMEHWSAPLAVKAIHEHDLVCSSAGAFHLSQLLDEKGDAELGRFRAMLLGGAVIDPAIVERAERHGIQAFRVYGSSELPSLTCGAPWETLAQRSQTDGRLTRGNELMLVDEQGDPVAAGAPGEVLCRGPELFEGFIDPALNAEAFTEDGWYRTGDIGIVGDDGRLSIVDRKKDIIIRGGENLSSREIEEVMATYPGVRACAAVGMPDPLYGERVAVFIEGDDAPTLDLESVGRHFASAGLARQKTPEAVFLVDTLPRTASGKIRKAELRRRLADKDDRFAHRQTSADLPARLNIRE